MTETQICQARRTSTPPLLRRALLPSALLWSVLAVGLALVACGNPFATTPSSQSPSDEEDTARAERVTPEDRGATVDQVVLPEDPGIEDGTEVDAEQAAEELAALEKELELKERELALKEKELDLKERELAQRRRESRPAPEPAPAPARDEPTEIAEQPAPISAPEPAPEPEPEPEPVVTWLDVPAGREMDVELLTGLSSETSRNGDTFRTRILDPIYAQNGELAIPAGSEVLGVVVEATTNDRRIGGRSRLVLEFTDLVLPSGGTVPIQASFAEESKSGKKKDAATIGGAAAAGAILGRILGDDEAVVVGAILGGAAGTAIASRNKGQNVEIPEGFVLRLQLDEPLAVRVER